MICINDNIFEYDKFPNGELQLIVNKDLLKNNNYINYYFDSEILAEELQALYFLCSYVDLHSNNQFYLNFSYLPYSRMDRELADQVCTLNPFLQLFLQFKHCKIIVNSLHSSKNIPEQFLHRILHTRDVEFVVEHFLFLNVQDYSSESTKNKIIVFPDEGALIRYCKNDDSLLRLFPEDTKILFGIKDRNPIIREIVSYRLKDYSRGYIPFDLQLNDSDLGKDVIIIDDLCENGNTAYECAKAISKLGFNNDISLFVYHLSYSACQETSALFLPDNKIKSVYATDSMLNTNQLKEFYNNTLNFNIIKLRK